MLETASCQDANTRTDTDSVREIQVQQEKMHRDRCRALRRRCGKLPQDCTNTLSNTLSPEDGSYESMSMCAFGMPGEDPSARVECVANGPSAPLTGTLSRWSLRPLSHTSNTAFGVSSTQMFVSA